MERDMENRPSRNVHVPRYTHQTRHPADTMTPAPQRGIMPFRSQATQRSLCASTPSTEHTAMNLLKRLWQWYSNRRTERRMLKGHGVYRTQTNQSHIPGKKMPTLPISTSS